MECQSWIYSRALSPLNFFQQLTGGKKEASISQLFVSPGKEERVTASNLLILGLRHTHYASYKV